MFLTGFADEASQDFTVQLKATKELGWSHIEARGINGKNLATLTEAEFDVICQQMDEAGVTINCFGSGVANWAKHPRKEEDFQASMKELTDALPRMKKLGIKLIRGMSFLRPTDEEPDNPELEEIIFRKVRALVEVCADNGIIYGHENCMNYGGMSHLHTLKLLEKVNNPSLRLIFDTGNPVSNYRRIGQKPYTLQSSWEFYRNVREFIEYVHIKDAISFVQKDGSKTEEYTYPGHGLGDVAAIVTDLRKTGYDGGFSMEPHMTVVFHDSAKQVEGEERYKNYVTYGQKFEALLKECGWTL